MRLIDADEAYKVLTDYYHHKTEIQHNALKEAIERVPTVDAVEAVRCKDCKFFRRYGFRLEYADCIKFDYYDTTEDGYCSWGERREDVHESD